jgi:hypothetical protein
MLCRKTRQRFVPIFIFISDEAGSNQTSKVRENNQNGLRWAFLPLFLLGFSFVDHF